MIGQTFSIPHAIAAKPVFNAVHPKYFFRANRQYIIAHDVISTLHPWFNGKVKVDIAVPADEDIIISRDKAPLFKEWMGA